MVLYKSVAIVDRGLRKRVNLQYPVYANYNSSSATAFYSFTASTSGAVLYRDLYNDVLSSPEYTNYISQYNYVKINGIELSSVPSFTNSTSITDLPPIFFNLLAGVASGPSNYYAVARADNSMEVKMNSQGDRPTVRNFRFPSILTGLGGYPLGGTQMWIPSNGLAAAAYQYLVLGYLTPPAFTVAANTAIRVGVVDVFVVIDFGGQSYSV